MAESTIIRSGEPEPKQNAKKVPDLRPVETPGYGADGQGLNSPKRKGPGEMGHSEIPKNLNLEEEGGKSDSFVLQIPQITKIKK
jgi:hypothetical protein